MSLPSLEALENSLSDRFDSILASVQRTKPGDSLVGHKTQSAALCKVLEEVSALYSWDRPAHHSSVKKGEKAEQKMGNSVVVVTKLPDDLEELNRFLGSGAMRMKPTVRELLDTFTSKRINSQFTGDLKIALHILDTGEEMGGFKVEVAQLFNCALKEMRGGVLPLSSLSNLICTKLDTNSQSSTLVCSSRSMQRIPSSAAIQAHLAEVAVPSKLMDKSYMQGKVKVGEGVLGLEYVKCGVELSDLESRGFIRNTLFKPGQRWSKSFSVWSDKSLSFSAVLLYLLHSGQCLVMENKDNVMAVMFYQTDSSAFFCTMDKVESHFYHLLLCLDSNTPTITLSEEVNTLITDINTLQLSPSKKTVFVPKPGTPQLDMSILESWRLPDLPAKQVTTSLKAASLTSKESSYLKLMLALSESYTSMAVMNRKGEKMKCIGEARGITNSSDPDVTAVKQKKKLSTMFTASVGTSGVTEVGKTKGGRLNLSRGEMLSQLGERNNSFVTEAGDKSLTTSLTRQINIGKSLKLVTPGRKTPLQSPHNLPSVPSPLTTHCSSRLTPGKSPPRRDIGLSSSRVISLTRKVLVKTQTKSTASSLRNSHIFKPIRFSLCGAVPSKKDDLNLASLEVESSHRRNPSIASSLDNSGFLSPSPTAFGKKEVLDQMTNILSRELEQPKWFKEPSCEQHFLPPMMSTQQNSPQVSRTCLVKKPSSELNLLPSMDFPIIPSETTQKMTMSSSFVDLSCTMQRTPVKNETQVKCFGQEYEEMKFISPAKRVEDNIVKTLESEDEEDEDQADGVMVSENVGDEVVAEAAEDIKLPAQCLKLRKTDSQLSVVGSFDRTSSEPITSSGYSSERQADPSCSGYMSDQSSPGKVPVSAVGTRRKRQNRLESWKDVEANEEIKNVVNPFEFSEDESFEILKYNPLKRKVNNFISGEESSASNKRLKSIIDEGVHPVIENKNINDFRDNKNFTSKQNSKLMSIFDDLQLCAQNYETSEGNKKKKSLFLSEICLAQCLNCNFTAVDFHDFLDSKMHHCISDYEGLRCNTCQERVRNVEGLSKHSAEHEQCVLFLMPETHLLNLNQDLCSSNCPEKSCFKASKAKLAEIKDDLTSMKMSELHDFLLVRLQSQKELGMDSKNMFVFKSEVFCHKSAISLLGLSYYMVNQVVKEHNSGKVRFVHGNSGNIYTSSKRNKAVAFILNFVRTHCENLPDHEVMRLPSYLNVNEIYKNYIESVPKMLQLKERSFYHVFKIHFKDVSRLPVGLPRVTFMAKHSHPMCVECDQVNTLCKVAKNESDVIYANERKKKHMLEMKEKFLQFCDRREQAVRFPEDFLHLNLDDIDQSKMKTPYALQKTKDCSGMLKLDNHCTGVIVTNGKFVNDRCLFAYLNNNQFCQDSNKTISIVFDVLLCVKEKLGCLPRKLLIQSDNCSRDLKNQLVLSFYWCLVEIGVFEEVVVSHLDVGHTHGEVDQMFSVMASHLRKKEMPTFEALCSELKKISIDSQPIIVKEMIYTTDFVKHIEEYLQPISGHKSFFAFKIRKENEKTKMFVKQDVLDKIWQFDTGIWLLKSPPTMLNLGVSPFRSENDFGEIFSSVWNKYIPSLSVKYSEENVMKIKADWEERISFLVNLEESQFEGFDVFQLVSDSQRSGVLSETFESRIEKDTRRKEASLTAMFYPQEIKTFDVSDLVMNCSLVFFTHIKSSRPWIGLFKELKEEDTGVQIKVQWLKKQKNVFVLDVDVPHSVLDINSVMFCDVLKNISESGNKKGPYVLEAETKKNIMDAYVERDIALS